MHLVLLSGLLVALAGGVLGGNHVQAAGAATGAYLLPSNSALYSVAAQATLTATTGAADTSPTAAATSAVTATATLTTTGGTQATPIPQATVGPQGGNLRLNPFDWQFLTSPPPGNAPLGPFGWAFTALMVGLFAVGAYFYFFKRAEWRGTNSVHRRAAERWGPMAMWIAGLALLFVLFRVITLDFFNLRIWLYLWFLATLAAAGWFYYWFRTKYPKEMARFQKKQRARQYMPTSGKKRSAHQPAATQTVGTTRVAPTSAAGTTAQVSASAAPGGLVPRARPTGGAANKKRRKKR